jgi:hypothetical protein
MRPTTTKARRGCGAARALTGPGRLGLVVLGLEQEEVWLQQVFFGGRSRHRGLRRSTVFRWGSPHSDRASASTHADRIAGIRSGRGCLHRRGTDAHGASALGYRCRKNWLGWHSGTDSGELPGRGRAGALRDCPRARGRRSLREPRRGPREPDPGVGLRWREPRARPRCPLHWIRSLSLANLRAEAECVGESLGLVGESERPSRSITTTSVSADQWTERSSDTTSVDRA